MSGHSKWANIKRTKGVNDAKRAKIFTKLSRAISVAVKKGKSSDSESNPSLRKAVDDARAANMPKDNIERAVAKGSGAGGEAPLEEFVLEGYGPAGVALFIRILSDNRNRTLSEVRSVLAKFGGNLGEKGSAAYIFGATPENPSFNIGVEAPEEARKVLGLVEALEDLDDVQEVFSNFEIPDEILTAT